MTARSRARWAFVVLGVVASTVVPASGATAGAAAVDCGVTCITGYYLAAADGGVFAFGDAPFFGSMAGKALAAPVVDIASLFNWAGKPLAKKVQVPGYYLAAADGGVFAFGAAPFFGSMAGKALSAPIVGIVASPSAEGYWLLGADGAIYSFGDAKLPLPSTTSLQAPVVDFDLTWTGDIFFAARRGGGGSAGSAEYDGQSWGTLSVNAAGARLVGSPLNSNEVETEPLIPSPLAGPIVAASAVSASEFYLAAADGGVFTFGFGMPFFGSMAGKALASPVVGVAATRRSGYLLAAADGGVFAFGDVPFFGSMGGRPLAAPVVGVAATLGT